MNNESNNSTAETRVPVGRSVLFCNRCGYHWSPRNPDKMPRSCPSCRSVVWMKKYDTKDCKRCGHQWSSTDEAPKRCPACGTYKWDESPISYQCTKCRYKWNSKREWSPKRCPNCRSTTWMNTPPKKEEKPEKESKRTYATVVSEEEIQKVIDLYDKGQSCTKISMSSGIPFSIVYEIISDNTQTGPPKV